ncbi:hypothetical protein [Shimia abyssi]|nr:hypothetical protein [Shimia abyssi]
MKIKLHFVPGVDVEGYGGLPAEDIQAIEWNTIITSYTTTHNA